MGFPSDSRRRILAAVALSERVCGLQEDSILSPLRERDNVTARQMVYVYARLTWKYTYQRIGTVVKRNHSTVVYSVKRHHEMLGKYPHTGKYVYPDYVSNWTTFEEIMNDRYKAKANHCHSCGQDMDIYESENLDVVTNNNYETA